MRHGVHLPPDERERMARRAAAMRDAGASILDIEVEFAVSNPTARNLVSFGRWLTNQDQQP
jgi:hypothetical protein